MAEEENKLLNKIQSEVNSKNHETDLENEKVLKQIEELKEQIIIYKKGDPEGRKKNHQLKKQLATLENTLANNIEALENAQRNQDVLEIQVKQITEQDEELTARVKKLEKAVHIYHNYKKNFPRCSSTILNIVDLESQLHFYSTQIIRVRNSVKCQIERIEKAKTMISEKEKQLVDLQSNLESINKNVQTNEAIKNNLYDELQGFNLEFEIINNERKKTDEHFHDVIERNRQKDLKSFHELSLQREKLTKLNNQISNFPDLLKKTKKKNKTE